MFKDLAMEMLECKSDLCNIKASGVLEEDPLPLKVHEQFTSTQVLQNQVQLSLRLVRVFFSKLGHQRRHTTPGRHRVGPQ